MALLMLYALSLCQQAAPIHARTLRRFGVARVWYCNKEDQPLFNAADDTFTIDHILPTAHGGKSKRGNLLGCCRACHMEKDT